MRAFLIVAGSVVAAVAIVLGAMSAARTAALKLTSPEQVGLAYVADAKIGNCAWVDELFVRPLGQEGCAEHPTVRSPVFVAKPAPRSVCRPFAGCRRAFSVGVTFRSGFTGWVAYAPPTSTRLGVAPSWRLIVGEMAGGDYKILGLAPS